MKKKRGSSVKSEKTRFAGHTFNTMSNEDLFLRELAHWIKNSENILTGTDMKKHDIFIRSFGNQAPSVLGIEKEFHKKESNKFYTRDKLSYEFYKPVRKTHFQEIELKPAMNRMFSYRHCELLRRILKAVKENFKRFMFYVFSEYAQGKVIEGVDHLRETIVYLREVCEKLTTQRGQHRGIYIPDLHTFSDNSLRVSHSLAFMNDWVKPYPEREIYTYGFSQETARVFSAELKRIILEGVADYGYILHDTDVIPDKVPNSRFGFDIPKDLRRRMDMVERILVLKEKKPVKSKVGKTHINREQGKLVVLLEALHRLKTIKNDTGIYQQALALAILTDNSYHTFSHKLRKPNHFDFKAVYGKEKKEIIRKELKDFHEKLGKEIENILLDS